MAAGRYDYAQRRVQIKFESLQLFGLVWFSRSGSLRSFSHAICSELQSSRFLDRINCDYRGVKTELIANETTLIATRLQSSGSNHINCE